MSKIKLSKEFIKSNVKLALNEDLYPSGDITSGLIDNDKVVTVKLISNQSAIVGGLLFAKQTFALIDNIASSELNSLVLKAIKNKKGKKITVEVDTISQLKSILGLKFNTFLLDNMSIKNLKDSVKIAKKYYQTEASGNITLKTVKAIASTGVNRISVGSITHSAPAVDFKLEI